MSSSARSGVTNLFDRSLAHPAIKNNYHWAGHGAKVHKVYDIAKTPYQRLQESGVLTPAKQSELATIYQGLNPVQLLRQLNGNLERLWKLAERTSPVAKARDETISVTWIFESTKAVR